jgi:hypothetical protein
MLKLCFVALATASFLAARTYAIDFAQSVVAYNPGSGFATDFSTGAGYTNVFAALRTVAYHTGPFGGPVDQSNPPYLRNGCFPSAQEDR